MIKTLFITLDTRYTGPKDMTTVRKEIESAMRLATEIRPDQEKELDSLLNQGWQVLHSGQTEDRHDHWVDTRACFILWQRNYTDKEQA